MVTFGEHTGRLMEIALEHPFKSFATSNQPPNIPGTEDVQPDLYFSHALSSFMELFDSEADYGEAAGKFGSGNARRPPTEAERKRLMDTVTGSPGGGGSGIAGPAASQPDAPSPGTPAPSDPLPGGFDGAAEIDPFGADGHFADRRPEADELGITAAMAGIGTQILDAAEDTGLEPSVRALQGTLNRMPAPNVAPPLKLDGDFGVKTRQRLRGAVAERGVGPVSDAFAGTLAGPATPGAPRRRPFE